MKNAAIVGMPNVGKTLFMINFAAYIGLTDLSITFSYPDNNSLSQKMSIDAAKTNLSSAKAYKTQNLQIIKLKIPSYKGSKEIKLIDTSGINDGIHPNIRMRCSIIQTLEALEKADLILHIVDIENISTKICEIDKQLIKYGSTKQGYVLLVNKIDLSNDWKNEIHNLKNVFKNTYIIPISALTSIGFKEVRKFVHKLL